MALIRAFDHRLILVTDRLLAGGRLLEEIVEAAVRGGVTAVQIREKHCPPGQFAVRAGRLRAVLDRLGIPLIVNDSVDAAAAVGAAGVHLGQRDMASAAARRILGAEAVIGLSVETLEQAAAAEAEDVDYLGVSPVFPTPTKTDTAPAWGLDGLRRLRALTKRPLVAIGGIGPDNAAAVLAAGADGLAVVSAIMAAADPEAAARALREIVESAGLTGSGQGC
jgi:thiamine-phosphate pyrophosphorylase